MTRKTEKSVGFGKGLRGDQKRRNEERRAKQSTSFVPEGGGESRSVLEQSSIDDLIATVELKKDEWADIYGDAEVVDEGPVLLDLKMPLVEAENAASASREVVSIPRRPKWHDGMSVEELAALETEAFMEWRRGLKHIEEEGGLVMTPYERNLDFWRQLWRCMERSNLLVQVLDARDPDFYFCQDLYRYVTELGGNKRLMLLVNKADYLSREQRQKWVEHFKSKSVDALFFSALDELQKQEKAKQERSPGEMEEAQDQGPQELTSGDGKATLKSEAKEEQISDPANIPVPDFLSDDELETEAPPQEDVEANETSDDEHVEPREPLLYDAGEGVADVSELLEAIRTRLRKCGSTAADSTLIASSMQDGQDRCRQGVVGFVGYPNVGKSTVINALVGAKKVGMSRTPGKTKHIQTLCLPEWGFTVCDAPGLVFPSVVATRAHLVINNTVPLDDLRECFSPIRLIVQKIGFAEILRRYKCTAFVKDAQKASGDHVLDEAHSFLAAFALSRNHTLWVGVPDENWAARKVLRDYVTGKLLHCEPPPSPNAGPNSTSDDSAHQSSEEDAPEEEEDEFEDLDQIISDAVASSEALPKMTKKKERHMVKQLSKGIAPPAVTGAKRGANKRATALA